MSARWVSARARVRSLGLRAVLVAVAVALLPIGAVAVLSPMEAGLQGRMERRVRAAVSDPAQAAADPEGTALRHGVRLRVIHAVGVVADADRDTRGWVNALSELLLGDPRTTTPQSFELTLPPLVERPEVRALDAACHTSRDLGVISCTAAAAAPDGRLVIATHTSRRAAGAILGVRYQILKLSLLLVPVAVWLGLYLGWRFSVMTRALDERNRRTEAFVADLVHEVKSPLAAVRAAGEALEGGKGPAGEREARLSRVLTDASRRLDQIVTALLELARAEGGMRDDARASVDVYALAKNLIDARPDQERITLSGASTTVSGSARGFESALRNLLDNAASFGSAVRVVVQDRRIAVEDDGPGIDPAVLPRVFDRFFTTRGEKQGTGLGLALTKAVVEAHGGTIDVESPVKDGRGARFTLKL